MSNKRIGYVRIWNDSIVEKRKVSKELEYQGHGMRNITI